MARIILASGSPRRQELLQRIGLRDFEISVPDVEEWYPPELMPEDIVAYISREKSQAVQAPADAIVITADTMVFLDDQRLGKPHDEAEALSMLTALSGRKHRVCTGVTVRQGEKALTRAQSTDVYFREASRQELLAYCRKHVAKYAMPYDIEFREELPKTLVGKVAYRVLEEEELAKLKAEQKPEAQVQGGGN